MDIQFKDEELRKFCEKRGEAEKKLGIDSARKLRIRLSDLNAAAHVSGVARWLNNHRPLIQLSLYGKTNDKFWFTFFHEAAHLLLHSKQKKIIYLDDPNNHSQDTLEEREANQWAGDFLIPPQYNAALATLRSRDAILSFAKQLNIHPGIVVGRLQHDQLIAPSWMNDLKTSFRFGDSEA